MLTIKFVHFSNIAKKKLQKKLKYLSNNLKEKINSIYDIYTYRHTYIYKMALNFVKMK